MEKHTVAPSGEIRTKDAGAPELSKNAVSLFFFLQSVVLAALFPIVVVCSGGNTLTTRWRLSLLLCSYFYSAVCVLSAATRQRKARLLVCLTYAALQALVVDAVLSRAAGTAIIYLDAVWIAGVFGHALAEHRASQYTGPAQVDLARELGSIILLALYYSAGAIPLCFFLVGGRSLGFVCLLIMVILILPLAIKHRAYDKVAAAPSSKEKLAGEVGLVVVLALVLSACGLSPLCIMTAGNNGALFLSAQECVFLLVLPTVLCFSVPIVIICTLEGMWGGGGIVVVLGVECDTAKVLVWWYMASFMLFTLSFVIVSKVTIVLIGVLGLVVFLGYCLYL